MNIKKRESCYSRRAHLLKRLVFVILITAAVSISAQAKYAGGSGTSEDPYQIANAADLFTLAADTSDYDKYFVLTADIDLASYSFTTAIIAPSGLYFIGIFDGSGHKISNLTINTNSDGNGHLGLFGGSSGEIKNLRIENVAITGGHASSNLGGLVGNIGGGNISNCYSTGTITGGDESWALGGLVGATEVTISNCYSTANVTGGDESAGLGGLVGVNNYSYGPGGINCIRNCYSTGNVTGGNNSNKLGGLVGETLSSISNCYSTGAVSGGHDSYDLGGLVGENNGNIGNCYFLSINGPNNGYGAPLTDGQMKQKSSFVGWDFENVWNIIEGQTCPFLISQMVRPVDGWLVQRFDFDEDVGYQGHEGIDVDSGIEGKNVVAAADGVVAYVHRSITSGAGLWVWICHGVVPILNGNLQADISTRYLHLKDISDEILPGAEVIKGRTVIGKVSNTGDGLWKWRFPPHLHFEVRQGGSLDDIMTGKITYKNTTALNPLRFVEYEDRYKKAKSLTILPHSPIDLIVEDPDGLIISKGIVEVPAASYFEIPIDEEENPGYEFIAIDNRKQGKYSIKVIPEPNALPTDTYSLEATIDGQTMTLACDIQIQNIPIQPYEVESKLNRCDFDSDGDVDFADLAKLSYHWLSQDCNYPDWCEGADLNYNHFVDLIDISLFAEHWLEGTTP
jgi:murein DD-endopeptidase MepM/ murein hydrolase activator NlpD